MSTINLRTLALLLLAAALSILAPRPLWAAAINIDDTALNETITVSANDFEGGLSLNGNPFQQGLNNPATATFPETGPVSFAGTWTTFGQQGPVSRTIYLIESPFDPGTPPPLISDILRFQIIPNSDGFSATIEGTFESSDTLGTLPVPFDPKDVFLETGNPVRLDFVGLSLQVISDVEVPEPSSLILAAMGMIGLCVYGWRRKR